MQILTVDIGTGTQDILLWDTALSLENAYKLVLPAPTMQIRTKIQAATARGEDLLLTGATMGGGPCHWAAEAHIQAGYRMFATEQAAKTFNDDLEWVEGEMGVRVVSDAEVASLDGMTRIEMKDFDPQQLEATFFRYGVPFDPEAIGLAVFDHGAAPPDVSDRKFRFDYLQSRLEMDPHLFSFAFRAGEVPLELTRMQSVVHSADPLDGELVLMDTAPAAVLGGIQDPQVRSHERMLVVNIGNFHTLAFRLDGNLITGLFEHHTGMLEPARLEDYLMRLAAGTLTREEVFDDQGHGALILDDHAWEPGSFSLIVTGPRRTMMSASYLHPYFAVPYGDMMLAGCYGLIVAISERYPEFREAILPPLRSQMSETAPWDVL